MTQKPVGDHSPVAAIGAYWADKRRVTDREVTAVKTLSLAVGLAVSRALANFL